MAATPESRGRQRVRLDLPAPLPPRLRSRHATAVRAEQVRAQAMGAGTPPRPRSRSRHRGGGGAVRSEPARAHHVDSPPRPGLRHAPLLPPRPRARHAPAPAPAPPVQPYGSPLAAFLYLCAALGAAALVWLCKIPLPPPSYGSLQGYRGLAAAFVAALIVILLFRGHPPGSVDQELPDTPNQILAAAPAPQIQRPEQPRLALTGSVLDADQLAAAIGSCLADITRPCPAVSPPQADSSDSDRGGASSSDGEEIVNCWYTPIHLLDAGGARLIVPGFIQQLQEMIRGCSEADAVELLRIAFTDAKKSEGFCYILSDVVESQCTIYVDPHGLIDRSTGTLVMTMKITAKLLHLIWFELDEQSWLCQEVKKECFRQIIGQSIEKLLDFALSLSNARCSAKYPLAIFDALVDVLFDISDLPLSTSEFISNEVADILDLPLNRYESVHNVVAHIFCEMVVDFRDILEATAKTAKDTRISRESTIHPATVLLVQFLEFFYRSGENMQSVLGTGDCTIELAMIDYWVSKLGREAETMFPAEVLHVKGQRCIFVLNNMYYVYQMKSHPGGFLSDMELESLCSLIGQHIKSYLEEYWVPLVRHLDGDSLNMPCRSSLVSFREEFLCIYDSQATWRVRTELREILREEMVEVIVPKYESFLEALPDEHPSLRWPRCRSNLFKGMRGARSEKPVYTAARLKEVIREFFEG